MKYGDFLSTFMKYDLFITGDALGQVASQTPKAMTAVDSVTNTLIARPLIGDDKNSIIFKGMEIETYDISIMKGEDMCSNFSPPSPVLSPNLQDVVLHDDKLKEAENLFDEINDNYTERIELDENRN
jgi:thiamine biosynthesis protein ThiI